MKAARPRARFAMYPSAAIRSSSRAVNMRNRRCRVLADLGNLCEISLVANRVVDRPRP